MEKAYAKKYMGYDNIIGGRVSYAIADMVNNGYPDQIDLKEYVLNQKGLWNILSEFK